MILEFAAAVARSLRRRLVGIIVVVASVSICGTTPALAGDHEGSDVEASVSLHEVSFIDTVKWAAQALLAPELLDDVMIVYIYDSSEIDGLASIPECSSLEDTGRGRGEPCILGIAEQPPSENESLNQPGIALQLGPLGENADNVQSQGFIAFDQQLVDADNTTPLRFWETTRMYTDIHARWTLNAGSNLR